MEQGTTRGNTGAVGQPTTPYAEAVARSRAFVLRAAQYGHVAFPAPGRPAPEGRGALLCTCGEVAPRPAPWQRVWELWTSHAFREVAVALGHEPTVEPAGKMDAPDLIRVRCACGYATGSTTITAASSTWRRHAEAMMRRDAEAEVES